MLFLFFWFKINVSIRQVISKRIISNYHVYLFCSHNIIALFVYCCCFFLLNKVYSLLRYYVTKLPNDRCKLTKSYCKGLLIIENLITQVNGEVLDKYEARETLYSGGSDNASPFWIRITPNGRIRFGYGTECDDRTVIMACDTPISNLISELTSFRFVALTYYFISHCRIFFLSVMLIWNESDTLTFLPDYSVTK